MDMVSWLIGYQKGLMNGDSGEGGSGGGVEFLSASGTVTPDSTEITIEHNLGVVPDYFEIRLNGVLQPSIVTIPSGVAIGAASGISTSFANLIDKSIGVTAYCAATGYLTFAPAGSYIDETNNAMSGPKDATKTTIYVGTSYSGGIGLQPGQEYIWQAFARKNQSEGGSGDGADINLSGTILDYIVYQIDLSAMTLTICGIKYEKLYEDTGLYDIIIPDTLGDFSVVLDTAGVK